MLLLVTESKGSSPGRQGFKMVLAEDGEMYGSIGGGIMEHKFVELARAELKGDHPVATLHLQEHDKVSRFRSGMICSGKQMIYLCPLTANDIATIEAIASSWKENRGEVMAIDQDGLRLINEQAAFHFSFTHNREDAFTYLEKTGYKISLHIVGGGHCALALSRIMHPQDFLIHVYEERPALNTFDQNVFAHNKVVVNSYDELGELIPEGEDVYVVIMTFGYRTDAIALKALLHHKTAYTGLLGSRNKIQEMWNGFLREGIAENLLKRIHAPAGVFIKSETPQEIAVSIAAEIIRIKNTGQ